MNDEKKVLESYLNRLINSDDLKGRLILARDVTFKTDGVCIALWSELPELEECDDKLCDCMDKEDPREDIIEEARVKMTELSNHIAKALSSYEEFETLIEDYEKENKRIEE